MIIKIIIFKNKMVPTPNYLDLNIKYYFEETTFVNSSTHQKCIYT